MALRAGAFLALLAAVAASALLGGADGAETQRPPGAAGVPAASLPTEAVTIRERAAVGEPAPDESAQGTAHEVIWSDSDEEEVKPTVKLRGRIHADAIFVNQSEKNKAIFGDFENAVGFRRARLGAEGTYGDQFHWVCEFDFAGGDIAFKDVYLALEQLPVVRQVRVGHFAEPFSLEGQISSNDITFVERSPIDALDPARNWGVGIYTHTEDEMATLACGIFGSGTGNDGNDITDQNDTAYTVRATGLPWYDSEGRYLMHLGLAFSQRFPLNDVVTFNQGPQSTLLQSGSDNPLTPFVFNVSIPATQNQLYNVEWAAILGPLSLQAEWSATVIDQIGGSPVFFHGSYGYASYFLTGEHRAYDRKYGRFATPRVRDPFLRPGRKRCLGWGPGAWEVAARIAHMDFTSSNLPLGSNGLEQGSRLTQGTLGLNWYLHDNVRLMFNYVHVIPVDPNFGTSTADAFYIRNEVFW